MVTIERIDHIVLTVADVEKTCDFYRKVLGMNAMTFGDGRTALAFGSQKINLHAAGKEFKPRAGSPTPGSADICLITLDPMKEVMDHLASCGVEVIEGPVERTGAVGRILSVYFRDPEGNLIEVANHLVKQM